MGEGIRAEVRIESPDGCPVAGATEATGSASYSVSKSVNPVDGGGVTEEFMLDDEATLDDVALTDEVTEVFAYGSKSAYRFQRELGRFCPCECIERFDCPVVDVHAREESLFVTFHAPDMETLQDVVGDLRGTYPSLDVQRLLRSEGDASDENLIFVDRGELTARQQEVLETAHEMGYFEHPKRANGGEVADELGISRSTLSEHLSAAQSKLLGTILAN
ncbi:helix-turn-helix domain-containing protein [Haloarchaeobius amylolyticus]|uniref:helix-turn-helix domain-containing protein n=1 Tax=Haloarchaeobius amylolyticus TaxID=1198296 RepID=UPI002270B009|nr:helix-turn-helix domain-containing protein [Haloarchaeobius amylolyticus]